MEYIGDGPYCYANATSMLLKSAGEEIAPSLIEVLTGVGLGANKREGDMYWFDNLGTAPDTGVSKALEILGFECTEQSRQAPEPFPVEELAALLSEGPAVLGPLDMSYLSYLPFDVPVADHFVMAYEISGNELHLHDPAGYPNVSLSLDQLKLAWMAERIGYRRGFYRFWTAPRRTHRPTDEEIYRQALEFFKSCYQKTEETAKRESCLVGRDAILSFANHVRNGGLSEDEIGHMIFFLFKLGARRALDFAAFFAPHNVELAGQKRKQAELFGRCHTLSVQHNWSDLADTLEQLTGVEEEFRIFLLL